MIYLYSGTPGSGKSLHAARTIKNRLRMGENVLCNFPVNLSLISGFKGNFVEFDNMVTPDYFIAYSRQYFGHKPIKEGKLLIIFDECQLLFNAREWSKKGRSDWLSFFTQHRKYGYDIILVAQFDRMIDRQIRSLIEYEFIHRKVSNFGFAGRILSLVMGGSTFVAVKVWYSMKEKVGTEFFHAHKRLYSLYDSYNTFDAGGAGEEAPAPMAANVEEGSA